MRKDTLSHIFGGKRPRKAIAFAQSDQGLLLASRISGYFMIY